MELHTKKCHKCIDVDFRKKSETNIIKFGLQLTEKNVIQNLITD
jgi:hypothetical protein